MWSLSFCHLSTSLWWYPPSGRSKLPIDCKYLYGETQIAREEGIWPTASKNLELSDSHVSGVGSRSSQANQQSLRTYSFRRVAWTKGWIPSSQALRCLKPSEQLDYNLVPDHKLEELTKLDLIPEQQKLPQFVSAVFRHLAWRWFIAAMDN